MRIHSYLSPKCVMKRDSRIHRFGVFAKKKIKKGELIALWGGYIIPRAECQKLPKVIHNFDYPVQIYTGFWLGPKSARDLDDAEMFNHSCNPNAGVKGQNVLVARRAIASGEEICFDYETTETQDLSFHCRCEARNCRRFLDGNAWKKPVFQKKNKGYFSWYIQEKIERLKKKR